MLESTRQFRRLEGPAASRSAMPDRASGFSRLCRYRNEFAGFHVCRAMSRVAVVTATDCNKCPVPETIERVDCFLLRARVRLAPAPQVQWSCAATDEIVQASDPEDCLTYLREQPRRQPGDNRDPVH